MTTRLKPPSVLLPPLVQRESPNQSARLPGAPYLIVVHRPAGTYKGSIAWLCNPKAQASAHVITDSNKGATQLVPWDRKAWHASAFNSASYGVEVDDDAWNGKDEKAFLTAARIVAFLCKRTAIPPLWTRDPVDRPGVVRHLDLGMAGSGGQGRTDPTTDVDLWRKFVARVRAEHDHGGFRPKWGVGKLERIDAV